MANSQLKLYYFNLKGRAELSRLVLAVAGKQFEDFRYAEGEWQTAKADTPFGQCPVLEVDGVKFSQSLAIATFLAREYRLYGSSNLDGLVIDQYCQLGMDVMAVGVKAFLEKDEALKAVHWRQLREVDTPRYYGFIESRLQQTGTGWMVGGAMSLADLAVYDIVRGTFAQQVAGTDGFPAVTALVARVGEHPGIKAWAAKHDK